MSAEDRRDLEQFIAIMLAATIACVLIAVVGTHWLDRGTGEPLRAQVADRPAPTVTTTQVRVTLWPDGPAGRRTTWAVRCPGDVTCASLTATQTMEPPGPCGGRTGDTREALIDGWVAGRYVSELITRRDRCDRERWDALARVLRPPAPRTRS